MCPAVGAVSWRREATKRDAKAQSECGVVFVE